MAQPKYSMFQREPEKGLLDTLRKIGMGSIPFSPLAQGLLTDKYLKNIPVNSRASKSHGFLKKSHITKEIIQKVKKLNDLALKRNQSLAQMAIAWLLRDPVITSVLIGASTVKQLVDNVQSLDNKNFSIHELKEIDNILLNNPHDK